MNINGTPAGTAAIVWNGSTDPGGDWTPSGVGSETAGAAYGGSNLGWDSGVAAKDSVTKFDNGSMIDIVGTYQTLEFWMNPQAFPTGSFLSLQWLNGSDGAVGSRLDVNDYVTNFDIDVWQKVSIPIGDFNLPGNAQKLQFQYRKVAGQHYYFDDIELLELGGGSGPYVFQVAAEDATQKLHVSMMVVLLSGATSGWSSTSFANVSALTNGLLLRQRRLSTSEVLWSLNSKDNTDLFGRFHPQDDVVFSDSTTLVGFMIKPGSASVIITDDDVLELVVRDNLSGLTAARAFVHYGVEEVSE